MASIYSKIFDKNRINAHEAATKSRTWFQQQVTLLSKQQIAPQTLIRSQADKNVTRIVPGELYLFSYDAKHQDTLPYWDMFPLVFPFRKLNDGFIGLNMHYLPYDLRIHLLDRLMDFRTNSLLNENTRLKYSWATIQGVSRYSLASPCVHRYLLSHVQSSFKKIDAADWGTAMMLPVERFVGATKQRVWKESVA